MNKKSLLGFGLICLLGLSGCATGSAVSVGKSRPTVPVDSVKIYIEAPKKFEVVGMVEAASKGGGSSQSKTNRAVDRLKEEAAKIGANGVLIGNVSSESAGFVGGYNSGVMYGSNTKNKAVVGKAIFVIEE